MLSTFRNLPEQPLASRRRFVVVATSFTFTLIVLVWVGLLTYQWRGPKKTAPPPTELGTIAVSTPLPPSAGDTSPTPSPPTAAAGFLDDAYPPEPSPAATVNVDQISTNLIKVFAPETAEKKP